MMPNEAPTWMDTSCTFVLIPKYFPKPIEIFKRFEGKCLLCFAARAVVAVLSLHPGGAVRPYRRRRRRIPCSLFLLFRGRGQITLS